MVLKNLAVQKWRLIWDVDEGTVAIQGNPEIQFYRMDAFIWRGKFTERNPALFKSAWTESG